MSQPAPEALPGHRFAHLSFVVADIDAAREQWSLRLGVPVSQAHLTPDTTTGQTRYWGSRSPARARQVHFQAADLRIELLEPVGSPSIWKDHLDRFGEGVHHVAFWVDDLDAALAQHRSRGALISQTGVFPGGRQGSGGAYAFAEDEQGGLAIELLADVSVRVAVAECLH